MAEKLLNYTEVTIRISIVVILRLPLYLYGAANPYYLLPLKHTQGDIHSTPSAYVHSKEPSTLLTLGGESTSMFSIYVRKLLRREH